MRDLRSTYRESLRDQIEGLHNVIGALDGDVDQAMRDARRIAHHIEGTGATYGFPEVSDRAAAVLSANPTGIRDALESLIAAAAGVASGREHEPTVLLIDDDPLIRELLSRAFTQRGLVVTAADSMEGARDVFAGDVDIAVIVLDLFLPDGDGRDLLRAVRSDPSLEHTPLIAMTGSGTDQIRRRLVEEGADAFFQKPFDPHRMADLVERLADQGRPDQVTAPTPGASPEHGGMGTVLVVDDDKITAALLTDRLSREGYRVVHRPDGASALEVATDSRFDAAILDVNMPRMNGFELLGHLRSLPHWRDVPILMLTATGNEHDVVRGFQLGADDYVLKPFSPAEISARVGRMASRRPAAAGPSIGPPRGAGT